MNNVPLFDYSELFELFFRLDDDEDCALTKGQFISLMNNLKLTKKEGFCDVAFKALRRRKTNTIHFSRIKTLIDAMIFSPKSKTMFLILYRGVASRKEKGINFYQFDCLAYYALQSYNADDVEKKFKSLTDKTKADYVTYGQAATSLFGLHTKQNENPFKERLEVVSEYSHGCRV